MTDTVKIARARADGVTKIKNEIIGDSAVKNIAKLMVPETVSTITEYGSEYGLRTSIIEFTKSDLLVTRVAGDSSGWATLKLATFPKGRIWIHGAVGTISRIDASGSANIAAAGSGDYSFGSTATVDSTLATTDVNMGPSAALIDPFVSSVGAANASSVLAAMALFDGSTTAVSVNLNLKIDAGDVTTGDGAADVAGKITIQWSYLAGY